MPDEIIANLYTTGKEFQMEDGTEYTGLYHRYTTNEVYTGATWNAITSNRLYPYTEIASTTKLYKKLKPNIKINYITPISVLPTITTTDITAGYINRYFIQKINEMQCIEIDGSQHNLWKSGKIDPNMYTSIAIPWFITGNINDRMVNGVLVWGTRRKNEYQIQLAKKSIATIDSLLTDPLQFYTDADFIVPGDINSK